ncbi:MAG: hypothetical protein QOG59_3669, partial [Solirubrobacteraceae bacterium]|nr:hypothetical protein [Solirubrobacteraceae bacterium]
MFANPDETGYTMAAARVSRCDRHAQDLLPARVRVLVLISSLARGGSEGQLVTLLRQVHGVSMRATVATIAPLADPGHACALASLGVDHVVLAPGPHRGTRRGLAAAAALRRLLTTMRPDVVYAWGEPAAVLGAPWVRAQRIPFVVARRQVG